MEVTFKPPPIAGKLVTVCGTALDAEGAVLADTVIYSEADQDFFTSYRRQLYPVNRHERSWRIHHQGSSRWAESAYLCGKERPVTGRNRYF